MNNLKQIALALQSYESTFHALPPAYTVDADGNPLHSWRTLILPYLEQEQLYATIDLSKSWNDPANAQAYNTPLAAFRCPAINCPPNYTTYMVIVASDGCLLPGKSRHFSEITDVQGETLMVIEMAAEQAVPWMAPRDASEQMMIGCGPDSKLPHPAGTNAAFVDGSVRFLSAKMPAAERRALISIAGND